VDRRTGQGQGLKRGPLLSGALSAAWLALAAGASAAALAPNPLPVPGRSAAGAGAVSSTASVRPAAPLPLSPSAAAPEPHPPFFSSTLQLLGSYGTSPLRLRASDALWLAPAVTLSWVTLHNDLPIYRALATGDARKLWLDHSMPTVSALGDGLSEAGMVALASEFGPPRLARTSAVAMQALAISAVYGEGLKFAAWSNRPYDNPNAHDFWDFGQPTQGMPSGHSFSAFAVAEVYGAEYGREWTYPVAALIGYSRVYNQDHWPSDVVVGALLGVIAGVQARHQAALCGSPDLRFSLDAGDGAPKVVVHARF
jgi:membrane-associated phospholipid phosphatase